MMFNRRWCATLAASLVASACATTRPLTRQECYNADAQLSAVLKPLESLRAAGCEAGEGRTGLSACGRMRLEVERLMVVCPGHAPTLMANAVLSYDERQPIKAQQFLDEILSLSSKLPAAAALRARIAIEEGNLPFAQRLLTQHIKLAPDHAGLRETYGAALYLGGQLAEARRELTTAGELGAPKWRVAYHLGLVDEASGRLDEARRRYTEALEGNPGWAPATSRLTALRLRNGAGE